MKELKGTQTEKNLQEAFAGESQARNKYSYFASVARKEGYQEIGNIFEETANNEKEHAKIWFKYLNGIGNTQSNLKAAIEGEAYEHKTMYKEFAQIAREEGFEEIAAKFEGVGKIEKEHEERYAKYLNQLNSNTVFKKEETTTWECLNCGHKHTGKEALAMCPVCNHPQAYFTPVCCK